MSNQGHTKRSPLLSKEERQEWNEQKKMPKALLGYSGGRLPGRSTGEKGREEGGGEEKEQRLGKMRKSKKELEALRRCPSKDKTSYKGGIARRSRKEEGEESWQEGDQMEEEQHLDDLIERRRMEGSSLKLDVMQKFPELVVNKRRSQGEQGKATKEKKKVPGWSFEEMKERPNIAAGGGYSRDEKMEKSKPQ